MGTIPQNGPARAAFADRGPAVEITVTDHGTTAVVADCYRLEVRAEPPRAVLADLNGRIWSHLVLLADVSRVDGADESYGSGTLSVAAEPDAVQVAFEIASPLWRHKRTRLRCYPDRLELDVTVEGDGTLSEVRLLGGRAVRPSGAAGTFRSGVEFVSVFNPTPTEPIAVVRPAHSAATLGVIGDASPGRLHGIFCPPPLCLALGRSLTSSATDLASTDGRPAETRDAESAPVWLAVGVRAAVADCTFTEVSYEPVDGGFLLRLDYDGHTVVRDGFTTPTLVVRPVDSPLAALAAYRSDLVDHNLAPAGVPTEPADWWREPIFSGWGAQCARAELPGSPPSHPYFLHHLGPERAAPGQPVPSDLDRADVYEEFLGHLARHGVRPGTVVLDDRWQEQYGLGKPDPGHWPDLSGWIRRQHAADRRVLLWWKAWDPAGVPAEECVRDPEGRPVAVDPGNPRYLARLAATAHRLVGAEGLDADGVEVDFTQRSPAGRSLTAHRGATGTWGIAALHRLLTALYTAVHEAKPDALVITHTPAPFFGDVCDMVRLNDVLERDTSGRVVPVPDQMRFRAAVVRTSLPHHLIDTDQWPMPTLEAWRSYVAAQPALGVPALYYAERIDRSRESLTDGDLAQVARSWADYRAR